MRQTKQTAAYFLKGIPADLWLLVKIRAAERNETIRAALLRMLTAYSRRKAQE